jgi:signal transduction histidine kinase
MWRHVLPPVLLVAILWLAMSGATTLYMSWVEKSYQRVFVENVSSVRAADALQAAVWRLAASSLPTSAAPGTGEGDRAPLLRTVEQEAQRLRDSASSPREFPVLERLESGLDTIRRQVKTVETPKPDGTSTPDAQSWNRQMVALADDVSRTAEELKHINEDLMSQATSARESVDRNVFLVRMGLLMAGPGVGIYFGMRLARRLQSSVSKLLVTLRDADSQHKMSLGEVTLEADGSLQGIQVQARFLVGRMRQVTSELQSARLEIIRSERLAAVGELAAGVAHELRNPLTSVKLLLQHAARQSGDATLRPEKLRLILDEINRMESTIQGLLDFSRARRLHRVRHDVRDTLQRSLNLIEGRALQQNVQIDLETGTTPLPIDGDPEQLNQIFVNLLLNAIEAMPDGGRLVVNAAQSSDEGVLRIHFRDSGPGISGELLPRLFEPFATTKERGTGLGLAVSRRIAEDHAGMIHAENLAEGGALFTVELPSATPAGHDSGARRANAASLETSPMATPA